MQRLCDLNTDEEARVVKIYNQGPLRRRLMDIGLIENTRVKCVMISPLGDPKAYLIRGSVMAIREEDSRLIKIKKN